MFPPSLMHKAMKKLGTLIQNRSLTTVTYADVSEDFLSPMRFFKKLIARTFKNVWSHKLTYDNNYSDALRKLYRSRAEVFTDRANIETILAIHAISEHVPVSARHFDRAFIENIIGQHIFEDGMAKIKDSEKLQTLYSVIHEARKYNWQQHNDSS